MINKFKNIEKSISKLFNKKESLFTSSGTTAIWLLLKSLGITGKKIIVPSNICFTVNCAIILSENIIQHVDIDQDFSINAQSLKQFDARDISGIIYPHMYGNVGNILPVLNIAKKNRWFVIEDVCQALGGKRGAINAGSFADMSVTSFGTGKIIDIGKGGVLSTNSRNIYESACRYNNNLKSINLKISYAKIWKEMFQPIFLQGFENRMKIPKNVEALIKSYREVFINKISGESIPLMPLESKLRNLEKEIKIRENNSELFRKIIRNKYINVLKHNKGSTYWRQNILVSKERDNLLNYLTKHNIKATKYFPSLEKIFRNSLNGNFRHSNSMGNMVINLWVGKETNENEIIKINRLISKFYHQCV